MTLTAYAKSFGIGAVAGIRSMTAPAATIAAGAPRFTALATLLAAGELVADKLPVIPARISPPAYAVRVLSGALCGGAVATRNEGSRVVGLLAGALGAAGSTWATFKLRQSLTKSRGWPDFPIALAEDAFAVWAARAANAV